MKRLRAKRKVERWQIEEILRNQPFRALSAEAAGFPAQGRDAAQQQDEEEPGEQ